jgi:hypothetical protein
MGMNYPGWLNEFPDWLRQLSEDPAAREIGLQWLSEEESRDHARTLAEEYEQPDGPSLVPLPEAALDVARELMSSRVAVARGPRMPMRASRSHVDSFWLIDRSRPEELWLALSLHYPPFLWIPAGQTAASMRAALTGYFTKPALSRLRLHRVVRFFIGNERMLDADVHGVENHLLLSPFTTELTWGSAFQEDPWPDEMAEDLSPEFAFKVRDHISQAAGAVYTTNHRLQHSRGVLSLEDHGGLFVTEVRYESCPHRDLIAAMNRSFGLSFPTDMPLDAVSLLLGFPMHSETSLRDALADPDQADDHDIYVHALAAVKHSDLHLSGDLRPYVDHSDVETRSMAIAIAAQLGYQFLLQSRSCIETDVDLVAQLEREISSAAPPPVEPTRHDGRDLLPVRDSVPRHVLDRVWSEQGWELVEESPRTQSDFFRRVWWIDGGRTKIVYTEDHRLGLRFFRVEGQDRDSVASILRSAAALDEPGALLSRAEAARAPEECVASILKVCRLAPRQQDARYMEILRRLLAHSSFAVRRAAVDAAEQIAWPEVIQLLKERVSADPALASRIERAIASSHAV